MIDKRCAACHGNLKFVAYHNSDTGQTFCSAACYEVGLQAHQDQLRFNFEPQYAPIGDECLCHTCTEPLKPPEYA